MWVVGDHRLQVFEGAFQMANAGAKVLDTVVQLLGVGENQSVMILISAHYAHKIRNYRLPLPVVSDPVHHHLSVDGFTRHSPPTIRTYRPASSRDTFLAWNLSLSALKHVLQTR